MPMNEAFCCVPGDDKKQKLGSDGCLIAKVAANIVTQADFWEAGRKTEGTTFSPCAAGSQRAPGALAAPAELDPQVAPAAGTPAAAVIQHLRFPPCMQLS